MLSRGTRRRLVVFGVVIGALLLLVGPLLPADSQIQCHDDPNGGTTCRRIADVHPLLPPLTAAGLGATGVGLTAALSLRLTEPRVDPGDPGS